MLSVPQSTRAIDSGYVPPFSWRWRSIRRSTTTCALWMAAEVGMAWGSSAWMFFPVGSTSGFRMGSPPGPGSTYSPSRPSTSAPSSLSFTTWVRQKFRYANWLSRSMRSARLNCVPSTAATYGLDFMPVNLAKAFMSVASMRPSWPTFSSTNACTHSLEAMVMSCSSSTSASTPLSELRYTSSMSRPTAAARIPGRPRSGGSFSGRSMEAMFTSVATDSSAEGGTPTTCRPHGSRRLSISISLRYTLPTMVSRASGSRSLASASSGGSSTSRSRLQMRALSTMEFTMAGPRPESFRLW
mmetsp:Transcript_17926/g.50515  ORF Transcript_17926/g.50515 Transcript_17926/m.50515 type:complete len:298 (-) Transcript_17926:2176-3069(-)